MEFRYVTLHVALMLYKITRCRSDMATIRWDLVWSIGSLEQLWPQAVVLLQVMS